MTERNISSRKSPTRQSVLFEGASGSFVYEVTFKKVKNMILRVKNAKVMVSVPHDTSLYRINEFVRLHESMVLASLARQRECLIDQSRLDYVEGGVFYHFGEPLTIRLSQGKKSVSRCGELLNVTVSDPSNRDAVRRAVLEWISRETLAAVTSLCGASMPLFAPHVKEMPALSLRSTLLQLGCCYCGSNKIVFARTLGCLSPECVRFVVLHEMCHLIHPDHSPAFYAELARVLPDHKRLKDLAFSESFSFRPS